MTTGTGLVLLGVWLTCAATWHSKYVPGAVALCATALATGLTVYLR